MVARHQIHRDTGGMQLVEPFEEMQVIAIRCRRRVEDIARNYHKVDIACKRRVDNPIVRLGNGRLQSRSPFIRQRLQPPHGGAQMKISYV